MRDLKELTIFLASPSDTNEERETVRQIARDLSATGVAHSNRIHIRIVGYEDAMPDSNPQGPQEVINRQLQPETCDVFVGIMKHRCGRRTQGFDSGTLEEYDRAVRAKATTGTPRTIMWFFCGEELHTTDPEAKQQFEKVKAFRDQISNEVLYKLYDCTSSFAEVFRPRLEMCIEALSREFAPTALESAQAPLAGDASVGPDVSAPNKGTDVTEYVGRDEAVHEAAEQLVSKNSHVLVVFGPHGSGKTRFVLEVSRQITSSKVFVDCTTGLDKLTSAVRRLGDGDLAIFDEPDRDRLGLIARELLAREGVTGFITSITPEVAQHLHTAADPRVKVIRLAPLDDLSAASLLKSAGAKLHYDLQRWVIRMAGGNPGMLLRAAETVHNNEDTAAFASQIGLALEAEARAALGERSLSCLRALSLLNEVDVASADSPDLRSLCEQVGGGITPADLQLEIRRLADAGYCTVTSTRVAVAPAVLADHLARNVVRYRGASLAGGVTKLSRTSRSALYERLARTGNAGTAFWNALLFGDGAYSTLSAASNEPKLLRSAAAGIPAATALKLERNLGEMDVAQRAEVSGNQRSEVRWALEELLFKRDTAAQALRCFALLAEAENETWGNNATGVFCESFAPVHPQIPLPVQHRLTTLQTLLRSGSTEIRLLVVKAAASALDPLGGVALRTSDGATSFDPPDTLTYGEAYDYMEALCDLLLQLGAASDGTVAERAHALLPQALAHAATSGRPTSGMARMARLIALGRTSNQVDLGKVLSASGWVRSRFAEIATRTPDRREEYRGYASTAAQLRLTLFRSGYSMKLRTLVGVENPLDADSNRAQRYREDGWQEAEDEYLAKIRKLASTACVHTSRLSDDLWAWLASPLARQCVLFLGELGASDGDRHWLSHAESLAKAGLDLPFARYIAGVERATPGFASPYLDGLIDAEFPSSSIAAATTACGPSPHAIDRVERQAKQQAISSNDLSVCIKTWARQISEGDMARLIELLAGHSDATAKDVLACVNWWCEVARRPMTRRVAVIAGKAIRGFRGHSFSDGSDVDSVAAKVAGADIDAGFELLEQLLAGPEDGRGWNPFQHAYATKFIEVLRSADRERFVRAILKAAVADSSLPFHLRMSEVPPFDPLRDAGTLLESAKRESAEARAVASLISVRQGGFWPLASALIESRAADAELRKRLTDAVVEVTMWSGRLSQVIGSRLALVEEALVADYPAATTAWLREMEVMLREGISLEQASERVRPGLLDNVEDSGFGFGWA